MVTNKEDTQVSTKPEKQEEIPTLIPNSIEAVPKENIEEPKENKEPVKKVVYTCRKCRLVLFSQEDIIPHEPGEGQESFSYHKRSSALRFVNNSSD